MLANSLSLFRFQSLRADSGWNREKGNYMEESEGNKKNHPVKVKLGGLAMVERLQLKGNTQYVQKHRKKQMNSELLEECSLIRHHDFRH